MGGPIISSCLPHGMQGSCQTVLRVAVLHAVRNTAGVHHGHSVSAGVCKLYLKLAFTLLLSSFHCSHDSARAGNDCTLAWWSISW